MYCLTCNELLKPAANGTPDRRRKYCLTCQAERMQKPKLERPTECLSCGEPIAQQRKAGNPQKYCSRQCSQKLRQVKAKQNRQREITCDECGISFTAAGKARRFCSKECRITANAKDNTQKMKDYFATLYPGGTKTKICRWCNEELIVSAKKSFAGRLYHEDCSKEAQAARYRIKTVKRQKLTQPNRISHEQVVREYGSDCSICGEPIDLELPRTHRYGLTVDHLIPVKRGGTDAMSNLRPAHWICNIKKSDKMPENNNA